MLYLARYSHSPVGAYHEVIMSPAVVRIGLRLGFWISRITVDDDQSVAAVAQSGARLEAGEHTFGKHVDEVRLIPPDVV